MKTRRLIYEKVIDMFALDDVVTFEQIRYELDPNEYELNLIIAYFKERDEYRVVDDGQDSYIKYLHREPKNEGVVQHTDHLNKTQQVENLEAYKVYYSKINEIPKDVRNKYWAENGNLFHPNCFIYLIYILDIIAYKTLVLLVFTSYKIKGKDFFFKRTVRQLHNDSAILNENCRMSEDDIRYGISKLEVDGFIDVNVDHYKINSMFINDFVDKYKNCIVLNDDNDEDCRLLNQRILLHIKDDKRLSDVDVKIFNALYTKYIDNGCEQDFTYTYSEISKDTGLDSGDIYDSIKRLSKVCKYINVAKKKYNKNYYTINLEAITRKINNIMKNK